MTASLGGDVKLLLWSPSSLHVNWKADLKEPMALLKVQGVECRVLYGLSDLDNFTLVPSIFMTGVHAPAPHPKSPMRHKTEVGFESRISVTT